MALIQTVHLSMANFKSAPVVPAVQNDTDRQVKMIIDDFELTAGLTGKIAFQRSDGTHYETVATLNVSDNSFTADIDQALTQPGRTMVQLKVTDTLTVSTFSFVIFVEQDNSGTVTPQEGIDLVSAVQAAEDAADRAESAAEDAEEAAESMTEIYNIIGYEWDEGHFISATGAYANASDRACTDLIPCLPFVSVTYVGENNHANVCGISFYDKFTGFISGDINSGETLGTPTTVTSPANTAYMRISTKLSILDSSYVKYNGQRNNALYAVYKKANNMVAYVDGNNGNDSNYGNYANPYKTINHAIETGAEEIAVFTGATYHETLNISNRRIHIYGIAPDWGDGSVPYRARIKLDGNNTISTILTITGSDRVTLEDIEVYNCTYDGCLLNRCENAILVNCVFRDNGNNGIVINNTNGVIRSCQAYGNGHDGFNMNYYGDTQFYNCNGFNNGDDGISHHQGTTGLIDGGEWYGNVKGGVASPCYGARVNIRNVYSHDNGYGIYAFSDGQSDGRNFFVWNCVLMNNTYYGLAAKYNTPYMYHNKLSGNQAGQSTGYGTVNFVVLD